MARRDYSIHLPKDQINFFIQAAKSYIKEVAIQGAHRPQQNVPWSSESLGGGVVGCPGSAKLKCFASVLPFYTPPEVRVNLTQTVNTLPFKVLFINIMFS